jgi:hypothetical protein
METNSVSQEKNPGRHRAYTPEQVNEYLEAQPRSGLTITAFCQQQGIHPSVFHAWKRRRRPGTFSPPAFREVAMAPLLSTSWAAEMLLPSGVLLRLSPQADLRWIGQLIDQVGR